MIPEEGSDPVERQSEILGVLAFAGERLLAADDWANEVEPVLERLGRAVRGSRVYLAENRRNVDGGLRTPRRWEWSAVGSRPPVESERTKDLAAPILVEGEPWGHIGFEDFDHGRSWSEVEEIALRTTARILAAAVRRDAEIETVRGREERLRRRARVEAADRLAGGVAHEFNNILTVVVGHAQILLDRELDADTRASVREIREAGERASRLVCDLLAFSRQEVVRAEVVDVGRLVDEMQPRVRRLLPANIEVAVSVTDGPQAVEADRDQLERMLMNLIVNARDAMPEGGRLHIEVVDVELDRPLVERDETVEAGRYVIVSVTDTGTGMSPEVRERIFDPFFTTREPGQGVGLGLSVVHGIVRQNGGIVTVESETGRGTAVKVHLPRHPRSSEENADALDRSDD